MKRICCTLLSFLFLFANCFAEGVEEYTPRGKSFGITKYEFIQRYSSAPTTIVADNTAVSFMDLGVTDYRRIYFAEPIENVRFSLHCEDTTDEVFAGLVQFDIRDFPDDYSVGAKLGRFITESTSRMLFAVIPEISINELSACLDQIDVLNLVGVKNSFTFRNLTYVYSVDDGIFTYGFKSTDTFENEDEFLAYREQTLGHITNVSSKSPAIIDFSNYSLEELISLHDQIQFAMWQSDEWQEVEVPAGIYKIGIDIPEGHWTISSNEFAYVTWGSKLDSYGTSIDYSDWISDTYLQEGSIESVSWNLKSGTYLIIEYDSVTFTPFVGNELGFKF